MIAKISGTLAQKLPGEVIVDAGGVGYQVFISLAVFYRLPEVGSPVCLYTHTHVREDAFQLFGFLKQEEKRIFLLLNSMSGIGPKLAMNILSGIQADDLARALKEGDHPRLLSIPGVGRKLAERMIVELKDKILTLPAEQVGGSDGSQLMRDAVSALVNLGYRKGEAEKSVGEITQSGEAALEEVLKQALQKLGR